MKKKIALEADKSLIVLAVPKEATDFEVTVSRDGCVMLTYRVPGSRSQEVLQITPKREAGRYDLLGTYNEMTNHLCKLVLEDDNQPKKLFRTILENNQIFLKEWIKKPPYNSSEEVYSSVSNDVLCKHFVGQVNTYNAALDEFVVILKTTSGDQSKLGQYLRREKK